MALPKSEVIDAAHNLKGMVGLLVKAISCGGRRVRFHQEKECPDTWPKAAVFKLYFYCTPK